tara:strand:+ start:679 stop:1242 length:564 start_codon:yes stop_codon:yes gene_type:complete
MLANKFYPMDGFYIKTNFDQHKKFKNIFLELIDRLPKQKIEDVNNSDWNLPVDYKREYLDLFYDLIKPYWENICNQMCCNKWTITNGWFQQYKKGFHDWHNHGGVHFSSVYYLELPGKEYQTNFFNPYTKKLINNLGVKEGDIITTPAFIPHTSIKNKNNKRKTVIVFNSMFEDVDEKKIQKISRKN